MHTLFNTTNCWCSLKKNCRQLHTHFSRTYFPFKGIEMWTRYSKNTSFVAHWNPATTLSFISLRYCTPLVTSIKRFGPVPSGPKHQIFLASPTSKSNLSAKYRPLSLTSWRGAISPYKHNKSVCLIHPNKGI